MKVHRRGNSGVIEFANVALTFEISAVNQLAFPGVLPLGEGEIHLAHSTLNVVASGKTSVKSSIF